MVVARRNDGTADRRNHEAECVVEAGREREQQHRCNDGWNRACDSEWERARERRSQRRNDEQVARPGGDSRRGNAKHPPADPRSRPERARRRAPCDDERSRHYRGHPREMDRHEGRKRMSDERRRQRSDEMKQRSDAERDDNPRHDRNEDGEPAVPQSIRGRPGERPRRVPGSRAASTIARASAR